MAAFPTPSRWEHVKTLVEAALDRPAAERGPFLGAITPPSLADQVTGLVAAHDAADIGGVLTTVLDPEPSAGDRIGPYRILGRLGAGGMGAVYRARRADGHLDRDVALKVIRHASPALAARFDRERRALALLEHAHIARLYDADVVTGGLEPTPYLAMELVEGTPITDAADHLGLGVEARIRLVQQVCAAVAYAHGRLVLHRDLKPSNVLVAETASGPRAVVLDFGIARLLGDEDDALTQTGGRACTPAYAAPEQLAGGAVTTATDVYGVGALLYELLAGARAYDLAEATAADTERRKASPPRPPSAVASSNRARSLRGDLDMICLKALDPDAARRYPTADALADDLRRHLDGLPIQARPATARYRAGRFVRRHRTGVIATALVGLALVVGLSAALWQGRVAQTERDHARRAAVEADEQAERAEAVSGFLEQILRAPNARWYNDAGAPGGPETPIRVVLDQAAARVDRDFSDRPDLLADLHHVLGDTYLALGLADQAGRHHLRTLALRESLFAAPDPRIAEALYYAAGTRRDYREMVQMMARAVAMQRARDEGNNFPFMTNDLAGLYNEIGRFAEAEALLTEAASYTETHFVPGSDSHRYRDGLLVFLEQRQALSLLGLGRLAAADRHLADADSVILRLPRLAAHHGTWRDQQCALGALRLRQKRWAEAEATLLACAGDNSHHLPASPFPAPPPDPGADRPFRDRAATALVVLYDATGRPSLAQPYRAEAARAGRYTDSLRAVFGAVR